MTWDIHLNVHRNGRNIDKADCPECAIAERHAARVAQAKFYAQGQPLTENQLRDLHAITTQEWVDVSAGRSPADSTGPKITRDKTPRLLAWMRSHPNETFTAQSLADEIECAIGTAHGFLREHRHLVRALPYPPGHYIVIDEAAERAAVKSAGSGATIVSPALAVPTAATSTSGAIADVGNALAAMTGQTVTRPRGLPSKP